MFVRLNFRISFDCNCRLFFLNVHFQIEIETVDKTGTFLGSLWESKSNVAVLLLEAGLAKLQTMFSADRITEGHLLVQAEERAKKDRRKVAYHSGIFHVG